MINVIIRTRSGAKYRATGAGLEVTSRTPLFSMARKLIEAGLADQDTELEMIWAGSISVAMRGRAGMLAKLTVREDEKESPRIALWKPHSFRAVCPRNRFSDEAATPYSGEGIASPTAREAGDMNRHPADLFPSGGGTSAGRSLAVIPQSEADAFDWSGPLVLFREQSPVAIYRDADDQLIIRQAAAWNESADHVIIVTAENKQAFVDRVCDVLGIGSAP